MTAEPEVRKHFYRGVRDEPYAECVGANLVTTVYRVERQARAR
jgi:hypothetical protein